eukprot:3318619-Rhodomonas_salina.1
MLPDAMSEDERDNFPEMRPLSSKTEARDLCSSGTEAGMAWRWQMSVDGSREPQLSSMEGSREPKLTS